MYNLVFAGLLREVRVRLAAAGLVALSPTVDVCSMLEHEPASGGDVLCFTDVSYVDDDAFCCWSPCASQLIQDILDVTVIVCDCCRAFGFRVNFEIGKTEGMVSLSGLRSKLLRK